MRNLWVINILLMGGILPLMGQTPTSSWKWIKPPEANKGTLSWEPTNLLAQLANDQSVLVPTLSGQMIEVVWEPYSMLEKGLAVRYPMIQTYRLRRPGSARLIGAASITPNGIHVMYQVAGSWVYVDPKSGTSNQYLIYSQDEKPSKSASCFTQTPAFGMVQARSNQRQDSLRIYRLAVATTGEYTLFHGSILGALSAVVNTINRVNTIMERDLSISFVIVADNDLLIYDDPATDPYDDNNAFQRINANQTVLDQVIGNANYDVGHVFATAGGGLGNLGSVCDSAEKAEGTSGVPSPVGDAFDVDFVAHELGHQLGANHTFNALTGSCGGTNLAPLTAFEPGSGSTIMSYAGLCSSNNLQPNSDPYFHTASLNEMIQFLTVGGGETCGDATFTGNSVPTVTVKDTLWVIPMETPFWLRGRGKDPDGDSLTYVWEQVDTGPAGDVLVPRGTAPIFRSYPPDTLPLRFFPRLSDLLQNQTTFGETLPTYARPLTFRLTARDNAIGGGQINSADLSLRVTDLAGPFELDPSATATDWEAGSFTLINWNVAQTNQPPVNCQWVDLILSRPGEGLFQDTIAQDIPNTGSYILRVPMQTGSDNRLMIAAADHIFFDISLDSVAIVPANSGYDVELTEDTILICQGTADSLDILTAAIGGFSGSANLQFQSLPSGVTANLSPSSYSLGDTIKATLSVPNSLQPGDYATILEASGTNGVTNQLPLVLRIVSSEGLEATQIGNPLDGSDQLSLRPVFGWKAIPNAVAYEWQLADNPGFEEALAVQVQDTIYQPLAALDSVTVYYWRVRPISECEEGPFTDVVSFQVGSCVIGGISDTLLLIPDFGTLSSSITLAYPNPIRDINVYDLIGRHPSINQIAINLQNPQNDLSFLTTFPCTANEQDFRMGFDDEALLLNLDCPPTREALYRPFQALTSLISPQPPATPDQWTLNILDQFGGADGILQGWKLELCGEVVAPTIQLSQQTLFATSLSTTTIESTALLTTATGVAATEVFYRLVSLPHEGDLVLPTGTLAIGDTFTQSHIDLSELAYAHLGQRVLDSFRFVIETPGGGYLGTPSFLIDFATKVEAGIDALPFRAYPNPATDFVVIETTDEKGLGGIEVYNVYGELVKSYQANRASSFQIEWADLPAGIYLLTQGEKQGFTAVRITKY